MDTAKIFNDEAEYITLFELSKSQRYSLEFLLNEASRGKLKSFKVGDDWLTTNDWFKDYQKSVKSAIQLAIADKEMHGKNGWVGFLPESRWHLKLLPQMFLILFIFSLFSFSLNWLAFSPNGHEAALSAKGLTAKEYVAGEYFLNYTGKVYSYSHQYFSYAVGSSWNSTLILADSFKALGRNTANVALALDSRTLRYKISDEIITEKINKLAGTLKDKYQAVAGAESIRTQIYFDDWKKSSSSGR
ncbi:MAG: hypothetical protein Q7K65_01375 [Candidatus Buchananbacteria bacterium]|nr:hypothetical protein [Candidatus Buchananbacteria bacterium]